MFGDPDSDFDINDGEPLAIKRPRMIDQAQAEAIDEAMGNAQATANVIASGNILVNIVLKSSLKNLWGMINTLQFVAFFELWGAQMPTNVESALKTFKEIAMGDFIPSEWLIDPLKEAVIPEGGDENASVISNMGAFLVILIALIIIICLVLLCIKVCKKGSKDTCFKSRGQRSLSQDS